VGHDWGAVLAYILGAAGGPLEGRVASMVTMAVPHNAVQGFLQYPYQVSMPLPACMGGWVGGVARSPVAWRNPSNPIHAFPTSIHDDG